ncbi:MAG: crossover junction endodeoxyribonuclease RuvC [Endomicrobiales bacterium]|nr:crossover junction endodeoxyribonuclease RuvC [Endomicrobiales bacterium]
MKVLGIDPGLSITGWGIVFQDNRDKLSLSDYGCIKTDSKSSLVDRLKIIHISLHEIITRNQPDIMAIEELFFSKEARSVASVGQARGSILTTASIANLPVYEYNPRHVKIALTGYGAADKNQIQQMVKTLLFLKDIPKPDDAADALAIAICHFHTNKLRIQKSVIKSQL